MRKDSKKKQPQASQAQDGSNEDPPKEPRKLQKIDTGLILTWKEYSDMAVKNGGGLPTVAELKAHKIYADKEIWIPVSRDDGQEQDWCMIGPGPEPSDDHHFAPGRKTAYIQDVPKASGGKPGEAADILVSADANGSEAGGATNGTFVYERYTSFIDYFKCSPDWSDTRIFNPLRVKWFCIATTDQNEKAFKDGFPEDLRRDPSGWWHELHDLNHVEFTIQGCEGIKKAIFLPRGEIGKKDTAQKILSFWKVPMPQLMLEIGSNVNWSKDFMTQEMLNSDDLKPYKAMFEPDFTRLRIFDKGDTRALNLEDFLDNDSMAKLREGQEVIWPFQAMSSFVDFPETRVGTSASHRPAVIDMKETAKADAPPQNASPADPPAQSLAENEAAEPVVKNVRADGAAEAQEKTQPHTTTSSPSTISGWLTTCCSHPKGPTGEGEQAGKKRMKIKFEGGVEGGSLILNANKKFKLVATSLEEEGSELLWLDDYHGELNDELDEAQVKFKLNEDGTISPAENDEWVIGSDKTTRDTSDMKPDYQLKMMNAMLKARLLRILGACGTAMNAADGWFFTRPPTLCSGNHQLLQESLSTGGVSPSILVVDDPFASRNSLEFYRDKAYEEYFRTNSTYYAKEMIASLWNKKKPFKSQAFGEPVRLDRNTADWIHEAEGKGRPVSDLPFPAGTHFIFCPDCSSFNPQHFTSMQPGLLAMGGLGKLSVSQIFEALRKQVPVILMENCRGASDEVAKLVTNVKKAQNPDIKKVYSLWKKHGDKGGADDDNDPTSTGTELKDAIDLFHMRQENKEFDNSVIVINPLIDAPDTVISKISRSLSGSQSHEMGSGDADKNVVAAAWQIHQVLTHNVHRQEFYDTIIIMVSLLISFLAIAASIVVPDIDHYAHEKPEACSICVKLVEWKFWKWVQNSMAIIPAIATLCNSYMMSQQFHIKYAKLNNAQASIVSEIYRFRTKVSQYEPKILGKKKLSAAEADNMSMVAKHARTAFFNTIQHLASSVTKGDMGTMALEQCEHDGHETMESLVFGDLQKYINVTLYQDEKLTTKNKNNYSVIKGSAAGWKKRGLHRTEGYTPLNPGDAYENEDDFLSACSNEAYVSHRVVPLLNLYKRRARTLSWQYNSLQVLGFVAGVVATLLAAFEYEGYVPISVAIGSSVGTIASHFNFKLRLIASNAAIADLQSMLLFWNNLNTLERRLFMARDRLVNTVEDAVLRVAVAQSHYLPQAEKHGHGKESKSHGKEDKSHGDKGGHDKDKDEGHS